MTKQRPLSRERWAWPEGLSPFFLIELAFIPSFFCAAGAAVRFGSGNGLFWYVFLPTLLISWGILSVVILAGVRRFERWANNE